MPRKEEGGSGGRVEVRVELGEGVVGKGEKFGAGGGGKGGAGVVEFGNGASEVGCEFCGKSELVSAGEKAEREEGGGVRGGGEERGRLEKG